MIFDKIENLGKYMGLYPGLDKAIALITNGNVVDKEVGKYEVEEGALFYLIQAYMTKDAEEALMETHERYMDLQWVISGEEIMGYAVKSDLEPTTEYSSEKDIQFFNGAYAPLHMKQDMFAIFFPNEGHKPCVKVSEPAKVKKAVFKIAY